MGVSVAEVEGLAAEGWLDSSVRGGKLWVRPVVLTRLRVSDPRVGEQPASPATPDAGIRRSSPAAPLGGGFGRSAA
jgi:hypothetical protein